MTPPGFIKLHLHIIRQRLTLPLPWFIHCSAIPCLPEHPPRFHIVPTIGLNTFSFTKPYESIPIVYISILWFLDHFILFRKACERDVRLLSHCLFWGEVKPLPHTLETSFSMALTYPGITGTPAPLKTTAMSIHGKPISNHLCYSEFASPYSLASQDLFLRRYSSTYSNFNFSKFQNSYYKYFTKLTSSLH